MKSFKLFLLLLFLEMSSIGLAQSAPVKKIQAKEADQWQCGGQVMFDRDQTKKEAYRQAFNAYKNKGSNVAGKVGPALRVVPVVVHVLYDAANASNPSVNISYNQVQWQIAALNAAFQDNYFNYTNGQEGSGAHAVDTRIQFCLAQLPMGTNSFAVNEPGVVRYTVPSAVLNHTMDLAGMNQLLSTTHANVANFPFDSYLNIWLVSNIYDPAGGGPSVIGYGNFPGSLTAGNPLDGVVMRSDVFGDNTMPYTNNVLMPQLNRGRIFVHEVGHYLGLFHTFTGGCAGTTSVDCGTQGDLLCDTPPSNVANTTLCSGINSCTDYLFPTYTSDQPDMLENYMSYADDNCMNTFTNDQSTVMNGVLNTAWPLGRQDMTSNGNLIATGLQNSFNCCPTGVLSAGFSFTNSCTTFSFTNLMPPCNSNFSYLWDFGDGNQSTALNPVHTYTVEGVYTVACTVTGANGATEIYSIAISSQYSSYIMLQSGNQTSCRGSEQSIYIFCGLNTPTVQLTDGTNIITINNPAAPIYTNIIVYTFTATSNVSYTILPGNCNSNYGTASFTVTDCCANAVYNGDFELGNVGFTSELDVLPSHASYQVKDPTVDNSYLDWEFDGLTGYTGKAMTCAGFCLNESVANIPSGMHPGMQGKIWEQTILSLQPNTTYYVGFKLTRSIFGGSTYAIPWQGNLQYKLEMANSTATIFTEPVIEQPINNIYGFNFTAFNYTFTTPPVISPGYSLTIYQINNFDMIWYDYMLDNITLQPFSNATVAVNHSGPSVICSGSTTLTASGAASYTWMPGNVTTNSIVVSPTVSTIYTVQSLSSASCAATATIGVTVVPCCSQPGAIVYSNYTFTASVNLSAPKYILSGDIVIKPGVLVNFTGCEILMDPNTRIIVKSSANFEVFDSWIHACSAMWNGIYLDNKSGVYIRGSYVEDAKRAIVDTLGATKIWTRDMVFNRNRIGIHLKATTTIADLRFDVTVFTTSNLNIIAPSLPAVNTYFSQANLNTAAPILLLPPYQTIYGQYGIYVDQTAFTGNSRVKIASIITDKLYQGIKSYNSKVNVKTCIFQNHLSTLHPTGNPCGIYVEGANTSSVSDVIVGGFAIYDTCNFVRNTYGIYNRGSSALRIANNMFKNHSTGIFITQNNSNQQVVVGRNKLTKSAIGIRLYDNTWIDADISENRINNSPAQGNATNNFAIIATELIPVAGSPSAYADYYIYNNYVDGYYSGIFTSNTFKSQIIENEIYLVPDNTAGNIQAGIHFQSTNQVVVQNNIVSKASANNTAWWQSGILGDNNVWPTVSCNTIKNMYASIKMDLLNYTSPGGSGIVSNVMDNANHGFWLDNNGEIGDQFITGAFNSDNQWTNMGTSQTYVSGMSNSANARFYTSTTIPFYLDNTMAINGNPSLANFAITGLYTYVSSGNSCAPTIATPAKIKRGSYNVTDVTIKESGNLMAIRKRMLFDQLKSGKIDLSLQENSTAKEFVTGNSNSITGNLFLVDSLIRIFRIQGDRNALNEAQSINNGINANCKVEESQKWMNALIIDMQDSPLSSSQLTALRELAVKCPQEHGSSVYQARAILLDQTGTYLSSKCSDGGTSVTDLLSAKEDLVKIYPNPASKELTVEIKNNDAASGILEVYNTLGQIVLRSELTNSRTLVNVSMLETGIYSYTVKQKEKLIRSDKIIILKQ